MTYLSLTKSIKKIVAVLIFLIFIVSNVIAQNSVKETGVRGVWVPAPSFTSVLHTYKNVVAFVKQLDKLNLNSIYLVSYAVSKTVFPSKVLTEYSTYESPNDGYFLAPYINAYNVPLKSPTGDPVRDLIDEAHKRNIKVFFWFEYGFMGDVAPIPASNPLLARNPHWLGLGNDNLPSSYNKHDYYFNAYHPDVQEYLIKLIEESLTLYPDLDGIQGDDRMPAMPRNSGYDDYTVSIYQKEHNGAKPPFDFNEPLWIRWRLNKLNDFGKNLYARVKAKNNNAMVSFAPNPYPWSMDNLMQEWPQWSKDGICDLLAVQCYRYTAAAYEATVSDVLKFTRQSNPSQLIATGIILMEGGSIKMTPKLLTEQVAINRKLGINSEIYFYNEALKNKKIRKTLKALYPNKVQFPVVKH